MGNVTIKEVAREAGVSIGTVSNALNGKRYINEETKQRVMDAVEKLNYIPNLNGKYLKASSTRNFGFFTNSISGPYFSFLVEAMCKQCERLGYHLFVFVTDDSSVIMRNIVGRGMDGVLLYENTAIMEDEILMFQKADIKAVFFDREENRDGIASVLFDSYKGGYEATKHLIQMGHKRIAFIECVDGVIDSFRRKEGYRAALAEDGLAGSEDLILQGAFERECTYDAMQEFIANHAKDMPDAFLAGNDLSAIGCIEALRFHGYRVPEDVCVMGFDDIDIAQYYRPALTTVRNPIARQGMLAIETMVNMVEGRENGGIKRLDGMLVIRESCGFKK